MEEEASALPRPRPRPRGRRSNASSSSSSSSSSPDFEFWMVGNPSVPPPQLLTADELFADGVLLPLHLLHPNPPQPEPPTEPDRNRPEPDKLGADIATPPTSGSKRWRDIFRVAGEKRGEDKDRRRDRKSGAAPAAEIGINIWPFARSRSAGNGGAAAAAARAPGRKVSSAPCSRSNSRGETPPAARRWAASPGRAGVHVGRSSPVWQIRRTGKEPEPGMTRGPEKARAAPRDKATGGRRTGGAGARVLSLNVNTCIGYRSHVSCRGDAGDKKTGGDGTAEEAGGAGNGSLFNLRNLFSSKKVF